MTAISWPWQTLEPGIYFDLPFDTYVQQKCLNAGGLKNILISETDFWCRSWMNPLNDEIDEETKAKTEGRAYHKRILEGKEEFYRLYAPDFEYTGDRPLLTTSEEIAGALAIRGLPTSFKKKQDGIDRLLSHDPNAPVFDAMQRAYRAQYGGEREWLPPRLVRHIELSAKMIEAHPELQTYFVGGYPEVTVIWDDPLGVRFKMRADYLKVGPVVDLKTFANQMKKNIEKAIDFAIASNKYHIQAGLYLRGREAARELVKAGRVFYSEAASPTIVDPKWLNVFAETPNEEFWYIFMQKGIATVARGAKFSARDSKFASAAEVCLKDGAERFLRAHKTYGEDPWVDVSPSKYLSFDDMPAFIGDV